ncbi:hypothetical protein ACHAQH_003998 [Verticillium albo-atrum]
MKTSTPDHSPTRERTLAGVFALDGFIDGYPLWAQRSDDDLRAKAVLGQRKYTQAAATMEERINVNLVILFRALLHFGGLYHGHRFYIAVSRACSFATVKPPMIEDLTKFYSTRRRIWVRKYGREKRPTLIAALADEWNRTWARCMNWRNVDERTTQSFLEDKMDKWYELVASVNKLCDPGFWPYKGDEFAAPRSEHDQAGSDIGSSTRKHMPASEDAMEDRASKRHCVEPVKDMPSLPSPSDSRGRDNGSRERSPTRAERPLRIEKPKLQPDPIAVSRPDDARPVALDRNPSDAHPSERSDTTPAMPEIISKKLERHAAAHNALSGLVKAHEGRLQKLEAPSSKAEATQEDANRIKAFEERGTQSQDQADDHTPRATSLMGNSIPRGTYEEDRKRIEVLEECDQTCKDKFDGFEARVSTLEERPIPTGPSQAQFDSLSSTVSALARHIAECESKADAQDKRIVQAESTAQAQAERIRAQDQLIAELRQQVASDERVNDMVVDVVDVKKQMREVKAAMAEQVLTHSLRDRLQHSLDFARAIHAREVFKTEAQMLASADVVVQLERAVQSMTKMEEPR